MLRSANDQGSEELVHCIEKFQQLSLEPLAEPPLVLLQPGQLPWDQKPELKAEDNVSKVLNILQRVDKRVLVSERSEAGGKLGEEKNYSDQNNATEIQHHQALVSSGPPLRDTTSVPQSSASSFVPASLADKSTDIGNTNAVTVLSKVGLGISHEFSSQGLGVTDQELLSHDDDDELNQFDDDTSSDGSESVQILHVDDPRLGFGQSVYVGRRDTEQFTYSRSQTLGGRNVASRSSDVERMSTSAAGSVYTVAAPSSFSGGLQVSPSDSSSRKQPPTPSTTSLAGSTLPLATAALSGLPPVSAPSATPSSYLGTQHLQQKPFQAPSVAQSVPASMPFGSSRAPMSSLGVSASMPPLRARAVDEGRANEPGAGLSEVNNVLVVCECYE